MKYTYKLFWKRNWRDLIWLMLSVITVIGLLLLFRTSVRLTEKITNRDEEFILKVPSGKYKKLDNGEFEEIMYYKDMALSYIVQTLMVCMVPAFFMMLGCAWILHILFG